MEPNRFSVIVPTHQRPEKLEACIKSIINQTYLSGHEDCVELIIIDDGSNLHDTVDIVVAFQNKHKWISYIRQHRQQRLIARNIGMRAARHPWICWIDDDDEYYEDYLQHFSNMITAHREYSVFQCAVRFGKEHDGVFKEYRVLKPRKLKVIDFEHNEDTFQHDTKLLEEREHFVSGCITTGQFIFRKGCLETVGYLMHTHKYGDFAIESGIPGYGWRPPEGRFKEKRVQVLGNPWGEDFYMFYKLTRYFNVYNTETILLKKNCR